MEAMELQVAMVSNATISTICSRPFCHPAPLRTIQQQEAEVAVLLARVVLETPFLEVAS